MLVQKLQNLIFTIIQRSRFSAGNPSLTRVKLLPAVWQRTVWRGHRPVRPDFGGTGRTKNSCRCQKIGAKPTHSSVTASRIAQKLPEGTILITNQDNQNHHLLQTARAHPGYPAFHSKRGNGRRRSHRPRGESRKDIVGADSPAGRLSYSGKRNGACPPQTAGCIPHAGCPACGRAGKRQPR